MGSFGEELRRKREIRGIRIQDISEATRVNVKFLQALEDNRFEEIPGGIFIKGMIRAYARHLGIDEEELLNAYAFEMSRRQEDRSQKTAGGSSSRKWWEKLFSGKK